MIIGVSAFFALALSSSAAVMNITVNSAGEYLQDGASPGDPANSLASNYFYDSFQTPPSNNNPESNFDFLKGVVGNWNGIFDDLPTPTFSIAVDNNDDIGGASSFKTAAGYDYVVFHFGNGAAGDGNIADETGWWSAWYLGGAEHTFSLPIEGVDKKGDPQNVGGFSSARYFNGTKVPDGGTSIALLGMGLLGLGGLRKVLGKP